MNMKMPIEIERMMFGFIESQVLFIINDLKLFDFLEEQGPSTAKEIANGLKLPFPSLERLLICATAMKLLVKTEGLYTLNDSWRAFLLTDSAQYCGEKFSHYWKKSYKIFEHLFSAIQENSPQWHKIDQTICIASDIKKVYSNSIYNSESSTKEFLDTMWASGYHDSIDLCKKYSFKGYDTLVDLGGANGSFVIPALLMNPNLNAVIMDYPIVQPFAEKKLAEYKVQSRGKFDIGNIFEDPLPKADVYSIAYVLSDWPEVDCLYLIKKVYDSLPKNGLILILEKFFNNDKTGPYLTAMLNLTMLLEMYGTHRSVPEYIQWLKKIGFSEFDVIYSFGEKHMIVGKK